MGGLNVYTQCARVRETEEVHSRTERSFAEQLMRTCKDFGPGRRVYVDKKHEVYASYANRSEKNFNADASSTRVEDRFNGKPDGATRG